MNKKNSLEDTFGGRETGLNNLTDRHGLNGDRANANINTSDLQNMTFHELILHYNKDAFEIVMPNGEIKVSVP